MHFVAALCALLATSAQASCYDAVTSPNKSQTVAAAEAECLRAANRGDALAQYNLAALYLAQDPPLAIEAKQWLMRASQSGLVAADYALGTLLLGSGKEAEGLAALRRAAEAGVVDAQFDLATALLETDAARSHGAEIARWYRAAGLSGDASARYNLGMLYLDGRILPQDAPEAWAWLSSVQVQPADAAAAADAKQHDRVERLKRGLAKTMSSAENDHARQTLLDIEKQIIKATPAQPRSRAQH